MLAGDAGQRIASDALKIADQRLNISLGTTKSHVHNLLGKLNARRRTEVADHLRR
jgi:DNA-binding NarL/FixJ family response regulator